MMPKKPPRKGIVEVNSDNVKPLYADLVLARPKGPNVELVFYSTHLGASANQDGAKVAIHSGPDEKMQVNVVGVVVLPMEQGLRLKNMLPGIKKGIPFGGSPLQPDNTP
ncbi:MAG: hypothetical protein ACTSUV_03315 [Candidatus Ranarchaeia archaeon]